MGFTLIGGGWGVDVWVSMNWVTCASVVELVAGVVVMFYMGAGDSGI